MSAPGKRLALSLAEAFTSAAPKETRPLAYQAAVACVSAPTKTIATRRAREFLGRVPASLKAQIEMACAERLNKREERSTQRAGADPLLVPFRARVPALRAKRKKEIEDWMSEVYAQGAETPAPLKSARVAYAERQAEAVARSMPSLTHERAWKRAVASLRDSIPQEWWHRVPSLDRLEGEATAEARNATIVALVDLLGQDPPEEMAAAIGVLRTFRWTAQDVEGSGLLAELRQILRVVHAAFTRNGDGFLKTGLVRADPDRALRIVARADEFFELLQMRPNELDNPTPPVIAGWGPSLELVRCWLANPTNKEPNACTQARLRLERRLRDEERARSDAKAHRFFEDVVMSGEFDDDPPDAKVSAGVSPDGSLDGEEDSE